MSIRRHEAYERFIEYFTTEHEPPYPIERARELAQEVARHALLCVESAEWLQRRVDGLDELTQAENDYDRLYYPVEDSSEALEPGFVQRRFLRGQ